MMLQMARLHVGDATTYEEFVMVFQNPKNQHDRNISYPRLRTLAFGPFYFLIYGVWRHVLSYIINLSLFAYLDVLIYEGEAVFMVLKKATRATLVVVQARWVPGEE